MFVWCLKFTKKCSLWLVNTFELPLVHGGDVISGCGSEAEIFFRFISSVQSIEEDTDMSKRRTKKVNISGPLMSLTDLTTKNVSKYLIQSITLTSF